MQSNILVIQGNVLLALMLRDIKTRFGGTYAGYFVALGWPLAHMLLLLVIYAGTGRVAPIGDSTTLFFATGLAPYMFFNYPARFMMMSTLMNAPLLGFPLIKMLDIMIARAILESIAGVLVICILALVLYVCDVNIVPLDPWQAICALSSMLVLAIGVGLLNSIISLMFKPWIIIYTLLNIIFYILSGIIFLVSALPEKYQIILSWNPILHGVEWFRSAYYEGYASQYFPAKAYPFEFGLICLMIALLSERFVLPRLQQD